MHAALVVQVAGGDLHRRGVAVVRRDDEQFRNSIRVQARADVLDHVRERFGPHRERPRKGEMVPTHPVGDRRQREHSPVFHAGKGQLPRAAASSLGRYVAI